jgi:hypothetical protein
MERVSCRHKNNQTYFSLLNDAVLSWWLMPIILATQEAEIRRIMVRRQPGQIVCKPLSQNTQHTKGLVEWLKVKALSSNPSIPGKEKS